MSSRFNSLFSTNHDPSDSELMSDKSPVHRAPSSNQEQEAMSDESPVLRGRPLETLGLDCGEPVPSRLEPKTNLQFYHHVRSYSKVNKISFKFSKELTKATRSCLKTFLKVEKLTQKQEDFAAHFAKHVPYWHLKAKNEQRLFRTHACKYTLGME